jgi:hypothetical protein
MRAVDEVVVELHHVPEICADRGERGFQVLERLHCLLPEVADNLAVAVDPQLSGDVDDARRRGDLDHMGVAGRLSQCLRIDESGLGHTILLDHAFRMPSTLSTPGVTPEWVRGVHA